MKLPLLAIVLFLTLSSVFAQQKQPVDYVNPLIGTARSLQHTAWASEGATFPGVLLPFGMVQITPDRYIYTDTLIRSFSLLNHCSGWFSKGTFQVMAGTETRDTGFLPKPATFKHSDEHATPYYYRIKMNDSITAEYTATIHAGFFRFFVSPSDSSHLFLYDLEEIKMIDSVTLTGKSMFYFFTIKFQRPFLNIQTIKDHQHINAFDSTVKTYGIVVNFNCSPNVSIVFKIGFSETSSSISGLNLSAEIPAWDFEKLCIDNRSKWNEHLGQIQVKGGTEDQKYIFYTALYHSSNYPTLISDVNAENKFLPLYPWDTYRSQHPLLNILHPDLESHMINSVLSEADKTGWLPTGNMTGNHNVELILDAYSKGMRNLDIGKTIMIIRKSLMEAPFARRQMDDFFKMGYVPSNITNSVTHTLEFAYNDWALAELIKISGDSSRFADDLKFLYDRAKSYRLLYNPDRGLMQAKSNSGEWTNGGFSEGTAWTYSWFVPHDIKGLINLMGGFKKFNNKLDDCFSGGHYVHDNEPPLHYSYLFNFSGAPWKTQERVRYITEHSYANDPGGLPGNDDLGALSSWYVFSAMGFYPVTPGIPIYEIGSPIFEEVRIRMNNGNFFTIRAKNASAKNKYIQSCSIQKDAYNKPWFAHQDILQGKTIQFIMGEYPDSTWAADPKNTPPSMTTGSPDFLFKDFQLSKTTALPNENFSTSLVVMNRGTATGTAELNIFDNKKVIRSIYKILDPGECDTVKISQALYKSGRHTIRINNTSPKTITVKSSTARFEYGSLHKPTQPFIVLGDSCYYSKKIKNIGGAMGTCHVEFYINNEIRNSARILLEPGQEKNIDFKFLGLSPGLYRIRINETDSAVMRVIGMNKIDLANSKFLSELKNVLALDFNSISNREIKDRSGLGNNAVIKGNPKCVDGLFGKAIQTEALKGNYLELPRSETLERIAGDHEMTMMCWVFPMEEMNFADIICKGEWSSLQVKGGNSVVNFYTNGWEGHEAETEVPQNWNRHWHHIAGVFDGTYLKLYIDGNLSATKKSEPRDPRGETGLRDYSHFHWNIGRNAQATNNFFNGYIEDVMIFEKALDQEQISKLMFHENKNYDK